MFAKHAYSFVFNIFYIVYFVFQYTKKEDYDESKERKN